MPDDIDPFAVVEDGPIGTAKERFLISAAGAATVLHVYRHPAFGTLYRCRGEIMIYPWTVGRKQTVVGFRGAGFEQHLGSSAINRLRRNSSDTKSVPVGLVDAEPQPEFELGLVEDLPLKPGDGLVFSDHPWPDE